MTLVRSVDLGGLDTRSAALVFSGMEAGDLPLHVVAAALAPPAEDDVRTVLVVAETGPLPRLTVGDDEKELILELYLYALGADGRLLDSRTRALRLDRDLHGAALASGGLLLLSDLRLVPGTYSLRVLLLHRRSGRLGLRVVSHTVPASDTPGPADAPLFARDTAGQLVVAAGETAALESFLEGAAILPTADLRLSTGASPWIWIPGGPPDERREALIRGEGPADVALFSLAEQQPPTPAPGSAAARVAQIGPLDLPPGEYTLRVRTLPSVDGGGGADSPSRPFTIGAPLPARAAGEPIVPDATTSTPVGPWSGLKVMIAYRDALGPFGPDGSGWNLEALSSLETGISGGRDEERLQAEQVELAQRLARSTPEALVPLLYLHAQLYRAYLRTERYDSAQHASALVRHLARLYAESSHSAQRRRISAAALASLGGQRHEVGAELEARSAYLAALELDEKQTAALVGAACVHESFGDYSTATDLLRRAVRQEPGLAEARLRLAINELRLGARRRALASLRKLVGDDEAPSWVSILAYQELARALVAESRFGEADAVLRAGMEAHPENQRLAIQRAAVLDHLRRPAEARQVLAGIEPDARDESSPRFRYTAVPARPLAEARHLLADAAGERRQSARQELVALVSGDSR